MVRRLLSAVVAVLWLSGTALAAEPCRFAVLGDTHLGGADKVTPSPTYLRAIKEITLLQPEFVVSLGDMIYGYGPTAALEKQWDAFDAVTKQLERPVYLVAGNHDVFNDDSEALYRRRHGKLWYSADVGACHLVVLDSEDQRAPNSIAGEQLAWLRTDLAAAKGKRIFAFLHQPLWPREEAAFRLSEWGREVHPLLAQAGVDTVFGGHEHRYQLCPTRDGVRYVITGGGGGQTWDPALAGGFHHFVLVTAPRDRPATLAVVRAGAIEPEDIVTTETASNLNRFLGQFQTAPLILEDDPVRRTVSFQVTNPFPQQIAGRVSFTGSGLSAAPESRDYTLPARGATRLDFECTVTPAEVNGPVSCHVAYEVSGKGAGATDKRLRLVRTVAARPMQVKLDGSLAEWTGAAPMELNRADQLWEEGKLWQGPETFSARAWVGRDRGNLYVAVHVVDRLFTPTPGEAGSASGDSVVLYLDGRNSTDVGKAAYTPGVGLIILAPGGEGEPVRVFRPRDPSYGYSGVKAAWQRTSDGYTLEAVVPLSAFPEHGDVLGFDLSVNDNSAPKHPVVLFWQGDANDWREASRWGRVRLGPESARLRTPPG